MSECWESLKQFGLCEVETQRYKDWLKSHKCEHSPVELSFGASAAHQVCFRPTMISVDCEIRCECGDVVSLTHHEHA